MRRRFVLAVIALHCLLLWLLAAGFRQRDNRKEPAQLQIVSLWITPPAPVIPVEPQPPERTSRRTSSAGPAAVSPPPSEVPVTPPLEPRPNSNAPPAAAPAVNWAREASLAARRAGSTIGGPPPSGTFSEAPKALARPCVPKESSLKWKGEEKTKGGSCALTLGYSCADRANWHLLDDMKDPQRAPSSVPHPDICD